MRIADAFRIGPAGLGELVQKGQNLIGRDLVNLEYKEDLNKAVQAIKSYIYNLEQEFSQEKDYFHLRGQDNILRYLPVGTVLIRLHEVDSLFDVLGRVAAAKVSGCDPVISVPADLNNSVTGFLYGREGKRIVGDTRVLRQTDSELIQ